MPQYFAEGRDRKHGALELSVGDESGSKVTSDKGVFMYTSEIYGHHPIHCIFTLRFLTTSQTLLRPTVERKGEQIPLQPSPSSFSWPFDLLVQRTSVGTAAVSVRTQQHRNLMALQMAPPSAIHPTIPPLNSVKLNHMLERD